MAEEWKGAADPIEADEFTNRMPGGLFVNKKRPARLPEVAAGETPPDPGVLTPQPKE